MKKDENKPKDAGIGRFFKKTLQQKIVFQLIKKLQNFNII